MELYIKDHKHLGIGGDCPEEKLVIDTTTDLEGIGDPPQSRLKVATEVITTTGNIWPSDPPNTILILEDAGCVGIGSPHPSVELDIHNF